MRTIIYFKITNNSNTFNTEKSEINTNLSKSLISVIMIIQKNADKGRKSSEK